MENSFICKFCEKVYTQSISHIHHELKCPKNKNRVYKNGMQGKKGSNHWILSKKTGIPYIISKESREKMSKASSGRLHTEETKRKISEKRKQYLKNNPDKVPYKLNHSSKISYPEEYFLECFKKYKNVSFQHRVNTYSLDFANVEEKLYLEVDGEQHYLDNRILKHDIKRTKN
jgi:very-short-patch-repair endonuclease/phage FluMu protein Com